MRLLLLLLVLVSRPLAAQELPPPGGWPLRPVTALRAGPDPPGGLVPYRQGQRWGFADTTGRLWIQPVFTTEPPRFGAGLLLMPPPVDEAPPRPEPAASASRQRSHYRTRGRGRKGRRLEVRKDLSLKPTTLPSAWNLRYGQLHRDGGWRLSWGPGRAGSLSQPTVWLLNARGEQLPARPDEALVAAPDGTWRAVGRPAVPAGQRELVAIESSETPYANVPTAPGRVLTTPVRAVGPAVPRRLLRYRAFTLDDEFAAASSAAAPLFLARHINWLRPKRLVEFNNYRGGRGLTQSLRYRHDGRQALFDERGRRLTGYRYAGARVVLSRRLAYWHWSDSTDYDRHAADTAGLPMGWRITEAINGPARRYGLLDLQGRELTPPLFVRLTAIGPNSLWVVAVRRGRLYYGLIDTLGRYHLPLSPRPLSLPDAAGLLRRRSTAPLPHLDRISFSSEDTQYPDSATVQYLRPDGRPAFAGRFSQAGPFWQGRALVRQGSTYGLIDPLGRWVLPPQPEELSYYAFDGRHHDQEKATDPLEIFDHFYGPGLSRDGSWTTVPGDSVLLLTRGPQGRGLRSGLTGRVVIPAIFDERPAQWLGAVAGERNGQPLGLTPQGQTFAPNQPASYPPGVLRRAPEHPYSPPLLERVNGGWRTRGGRQLWQD